MMGKVNCPCGNQISDVADPCPYKSRLVSDTYLDSEDHFSWEAIFDNSVDVWQCYECKRLAIGQQGNNKITWYTPRQEG